MSRALQTGLADPGNQFCERTSVALVGSEGGHGEIDFALERDGFEVTRVAAIEDLAEADAEPSLIVLRVEGELAKAVASLGPSLQAMAPVPVLLVCAEIRPGDLRAALAAGAAGLVLEGEIETTLAPSMHAVGAGQVCVPRQHSGQVEPESLSPREKQIIGLVVMGFTNSQVAERLFVAESTVKSHLSSVFGKLGVRSRTEAAELILDSERGAGVGILALGGEPLETISSAT